MKIDILTIFPDFFRGPLDYGIVRRAREAGLAAIEVHDLRAFAHDRHRTVDDRPFGGGEGMVLKPEPIFECVESLGYAPREKRKASLHGGREDAEKANANPIPPRPPILPVGLAAPETVVLLSPQGHM